MTWRFPDDENGTMRQIPMVLECEFDRTRRHQDRVDPDFKKLVQSRADARVWISTSPDNARLHIDNCVEQIHSFSGTESGD
jgi:hypothetical protein